MTLDEFEEWFIQETWHIESVGGEAAVLLAAEVRSSLFDLTTGDASEDDFRDLARAQVRRVEWRPNPPGLKLGSDSQVIHQPA
jgi:hypothetical protein